MKYFLVTIQDKELEGEPDIGMCVVEAENEDDALKVSGALDRCAHLAEVEGWGRCVPHVKRLTLGLWSRTSFLIRGAAHCRSRG